MSYVSGWSVGDNYIKKCFLQLFLVLVSYCCDLPELNDLLGEWLQGISIKACIRGVVSHTEVWSMKGMARWDMEGTLRGIKTPNFMEKIRRMMGTMYTHVLRKDILKARSVLCKLQLRVFNPIFQKLKAALYLFAESVPYVFTFEPLQNLHVSISKLLKIVLSAMLGLQCFAIKMWEC